MGEIMKSRLIALIGRISQAAQACERAPTDHQLLDRFIRLRDEAAFEELLRRYGPMVMGVCRSVLFDLHLAEDAFQATFLTLCLSRQVDPPSRGFGDVASPSRIACLIQPSAFLRGAERARQEQGARAEAVPPAELARDEMDAALNEELNRLPDRYRQAIVLCCPLGKSCSEAGRGTRGDFKRGLGAGSSAGGKCSGSRLGRARLGSREWSVSWQPRLRRSFARV